MEVIGSGAVSFYEEMDERPHTPEPHELWQESCVVFLWDPDNDIYAFLRLAQVPNRKGGQMAAMLTVWTPQHIYKHENDEIPLVPGDISENGFSAAAGLCGYSFLGNGQHRWYINDQNLQLDLLIQDNHPGIGFFPGSSGDLVEKAAKNHIEAIGRVSGCVSIKGSTHKIDGRCWRDHSWGPRDWQGFRAHRGIAGHFDDLYVFGMSFIARDGRQAKVGTIIRNNTVQFTNKFEIVAYVGEDGISTCGGHLNIEIDGEQHTVHCTPIGKGTISVIHGLALTDTMCHVEMDGQYGVGFIETTHHAQGGNEPPYIFDSSHGILESGLHSR